MVGARIGAGGQTLEYRAELVGKGKKWDGRRARSRHGDRRRGRHRNRTGGGVGLGDKGRGTDGNRGGSRGR